MSEPIYSYVKGEGWVIRNEPIVFDKDNHPYMIELVESLNVGDAWIVVGEGVGLSNGEIDINFIQDHVSNFSYQINERYTGFTDTDYRWYADYPEKFIRLVPL